MIAQNYNFSLQLENIKYDSLFLAGINTNGKLIKIQGITSDGYKWNFSVPKNASDSIMDFEFYPKFKNKEPNTEYQITLWNNKNGNIVPCFRFPIDINITDIHGKYLDTKTSDNNLFYRIVENNKEEYFYATTHSDRILILDANNTE
ncbi:MAG: hypothetical protein FWF46_09375 [Oscillospiraceae bacterium]|nr:hypothetical protein [Oscillospiraceae bacterium]